MTLSMTRGGAGFARRAPGKTFAPVCDIQPFRTLVQPFAETLDADHRRPQFLGRVGVADPDITRVAERRAMDGGNALLRQQGQGEILIRVDLLAALAGLAQAAVACEGRFMRLSRGLGKRGNTAVGRGSMPADQVGRLRFAGWNCIRQAVANRSPNVCSQITPW